MDPKYLRKLFTKETYELPADNVPRTIGRSPEGFIILPYDDTTVSREQLQIVHMEDGIVLLTQLSQNSPTYIGTRKNPYKIQVLTSKTQEVPLGNIITMGKKQRLRLEDSISVEQQKIYEIERGRTDDTQVLKTSDVKEFNSHFQNR